ncbi:probable serine/threonine-protein kinase PBL11 [Abrus precatorius]|uniref:non-specific serine/threonine protein kinase n=1 Tax=Abrus precatorius TaxID=3816 RepID=A0A8B8LK27_ABRPR|nr:probable serine/threonine-protein kinase PBL11 [Abrus precatorius]
MGNCFRKPNDGNKIQHRTTNAYKPHTSPTERSNGVKFVGVEKETVEVTEDRADSSVNRAQPPPSRGVVTTNLKSFTLDELKSATRNFRPDTVLGEGGFGRVFKGWIDKNTFKPSRVGVGIPVAVKKSNPDSLQGLQEWQSEVKFLGKFSHPNLVKLIGYCLEENQFLLVYEYMQKGSLESHLFRRSPEPLSWDLRLNIAIGAARGLDFLHTSEKSVIYRDFKSSNILLDGDFNAKLSDFGLAKFGPINGRSHVTTRVMGTYGYAAPEYMATGHLYVKSDVYGFGVVLLEMLTGLIALDTNRPTGEQNLVDYARPCLSDKKKLKKIMDPSMDEQFSSTAAFQIAQLILKCLESDPKKRPDMKEVLVTLEKAQTIKYKPKGKKVSAVHQTSKRSEEHPSYNQRHYNNGYPKSRNRSPRR